MAELKVYFKCGRCMGTGVATTVFEGHTTEENPCTACAGVGKIQSESIDTTEIMDLLDWLKKHIKKILKKLDVEEDV